MGAPPGLSPITVSERALEAAFNRKTPLADWFFDWKLLRDYYDGAHAYHHTVPVNLYYALHAALQEIMEEGLEARFGRHQDCERAIDGGLAGTGNYAVRAGGASASHAECGRKFPTDVSDEVAVRKRLLMEYGLEIGGGLGELKGKIWRIGTMGASATPRNVTLAAGGAEGR